VHLGFFAVHLRDFVLDFLQVHKVKVGLYREPIYLFTRAIDQKLPDRRTVFLCHKQVPTVQILLCLSLVDYRGQQIIGCTGVPTLDLVWAIEDWDF